MADSVTDLSDAGSDLVSNASLPTQGSVEDKSPDEISRSQSIAQEVGTAVDDDISSTESSSTQTFPLLDLPSEILTKILKEVLTIYTEETKVDELGQVTTRLVLPFATPKYDLGISNFEGDRRMPSYTSRTAHWKHLGLPENSLAILTASRETYAHACPIIYDLYHFQTYSAESFRALFTKEIGAANLRHIKALTMGLPHALKTMPSKYLGRYLRMLVLGMPKLSTLKCTTKFGRWFYALTHDPCNTWIESHRGLLWFAAWVTLRHGNLKFAVWDEQNTVSDNKVDTDRAEFYDHRMVELSITMTSTRPEGLQTLQDSKPVETENEQLGHGYITPAVSTPLTEEDDDQDDAQIIDAYTEMQLHPDAKIVVPATKLLLDSAKIRRTGFFDLATHENCRPYPYPLPPDARDSEAHAIDGGMYEDPLEVCFLNNKNPELIFEHDRLEGQDVNMIYLRATTLEKSNIDREMLAKNGPPPPEPSNHGDEDNDDGGDNNDGWAGPADDDNPWQDAQVDHGSANYNDDDYDANDFDDEDHEDYDDLTSHEDYDVGEDGVGNYEWPEDVEEGDPPADQESSEDQGQDYDASHDDPYEHGISTVPTINWNETSTAAPGAWTEDYLPGTAQDVEDEGTESSSYDAWAAYAEMIDRFNAF